jgi:hypothetical protein
MLYFVSISLFEKSRRRYRAHYLPASGDISRSAGARYLNAKRLPNSKQKRTDHEKGISNTWRCDSFDRHRLVLDTVNPSTSSSTEGECNAHRSSRCSPRRRQGHPPAPASDSEEDACRRSQGRSQDDLPSCRQKSRQKNPGHPPAENDANLGHEDISSRSARRCDSHLRYFHRSRALDGQEGPEAEIVACSEETKGGAPLPVVGSQSTSRRNRSPPETASHRVTLPPPPQGDGQKDS